MKVIILAPTPPPAGGIAGWTMRMKNTTLKNGWKVEVVDEKVIGGRQVFGKSKKNILIEIKRSFNIWKNLFKALMDKNSKVVHSCIPASTTGMIREYICAIITKLYRREFIIHYRCTIPNMVKTKIGLFIFRKLTNISDLVIVLNTESAEFVKKYTNTKLKIIPNFIEDSKIIRSDKKEVRDRVEKVLYVGGVIKSKGCYDIIQVAKNFPQIEFRLVGSIDEEIQNIEKSRNVTLVGEKSKEDVEKELEDADIFMFVSYFYGEGFSNALAEAMSKGLPCIVSKWAANVDMIENKGGISVDIMDIDSMIKAVEKLDNNKKLRTVQSQWNLNKVRKYYKESTITSMYVDAYEDLLKSKEKFNEAKNRMDI